MGDVLVKVPVSEQDPKVRATNFEEVCLGYNKEEAMEEATRCLNCTVYQRLPGFHSDSGFHCGNQRGKH